MKKQAWLVSLGTFILLLPFVNCEKIGGSARSSGDEQTQSSTSMSGGQPYDGKPYVIAESCPDGTIVKSRIVRTSSGGILYRENCVTIAPRPLSSMEVTSLDGGKLQFNNQTYEIERPAIPLPGVVSWFMQLQGDLVSRPASIYVIDMFGYTENDIRQLKARGHTVICAMSLGTRESWNPDASRFAPSEIGRSMPNSPGENWIDTRSANVRAIMLSRLDLAKSKGCQGVDFIAGDGYENRTGFPLTLQSQLEYNRYMAFAAHDRELILTLNGVAALAEDLAEIFDLAVAEQCYQYNECGGYQSFVSRGKPVLAMEYGPVNASYCAQAKDSLISLAYFNYELDGSRYETCP